jgi:hypothetical protein
LEFLTSARSDAFKQQGVSRIEDFIRRFQIRRFQD